jgi:poly(beta-D-mannuronate) lyase
VASAAAIATAMAGAQPGDTLVMTDGIWMNQQILFQGNGTSGAPIVLRARSHGGVVLSGTSRLRIAGDHLVAENLVFRNGNCAPDPVVEFRNGSLESNNSRLTRSAISEYSPADVNTDNKWVSLYGTWNRVDHCAFTGKTNSGTTLVVWLTDHPNYHRIDRNYFGPRPPLGFNGGETIRVGTSDWSLYDSYTIVEENLFDRCSGEAEIISSKSCENIYRYNTFLGCEGALTLRHGNRCTVEGNFFFGNGAPNSGGVRIIGEDHRVFNNYITGTEGTSTRSALSLMNGVPNSPLNRYFQVKRAIVVGNTIVDNRTSITIGAGADGELTLPPLDCTIADNIVKSAEGPLITQVAVPINMTWTANIFHGASTGISPVPSGIRLVDPLLTDPGADSLRRPASGSPAVDSASGTHAFVTDDMDGQPRGALKDIGADELSASPVQRRPLTAGDVGPFAGGTGAATSTGTGLWSSVTSWSSGVVPGPADHVTIRASDSITVDIAGAACASLTVGGALLSSKTAPIGLTVFGSISVQPGGVFRAQSTTGGVGDLVHTLAVYGDITHAGVVWDLRTGTTGSSLGAWNTEFTGPENSTVTIGGTYSTTNGDFNAVRINKSGNGRVILGGNLVINGGSSANPAAQSILTFQHGLVETGPHALIHLTGTAANVTGASAASYVLGAMGRGMANSTGSSKEFPVGDSAGYRPFTLRSTTPGTATGHYATVRLIPGEANTGSSVLSGGIARVSAVRYYRISYTQGAGAPQMGFDRFYPSYGPDDGVLPGNTDLRAAYSTDERATWTGMGRVTNRDTTTLVSPPVQLRPDSVQPPLVLAGGAGAVYVALADTLGGTNPLGPLNQVLITATSGPNGSVVPSGVLAVPSGSDVTFLVTPAAFHEQDSLLADGVPVDSVGSYTFRNVTTSHSLRAVFLLSDVAAVDVPYGDDWNLLSNPVAGVLPGDSVRQIFPASAAPNAFTFDPGGYTPEYRMVNGPGYWLKFAAGGMQTVTGAPLLVDTIAVQPGWNMVGSITCPVDTGAIASLPPGLRASDWFGYASGYFPAAVLLPGRGYWVKASAAGRVVLTCPPAGNGR